MAGVAAVLGCGAAADASPESKDLDFLGFGGKSMEALISPMNVSGTGRS